MHDALEDLIGRIDTALRSETDRPLSLHWSDVTLLRALAAERRDRAAKVKALHGRIGLMLNEMCADNTAPGRRLD